MSNVGVNIPRLQVAAYIMASEGTLERDAKLVTGPRVSRTLGGMVETYKKPRYIPTGDLQNISRALQNLFMLLSICRTATSRPETPDTDEPFLRSLNVIEKHALELLEEWWCGKPDDTLMETWIKPCTIFSAVAAWDGPEDMSPGSGDDNNPRGRALEVLAPAADKGLVHLMRHVVHGPSQCICSGAPSILQPLQNSMKFLQTAPGTDVLDDHVSVYHDRMMQLWRSHTINPVLDTIELEGVVRQTSVVAATHRIAQACWRISNRGADRHEAECGLPEQSNEVGSVSAIKDMAQVPPTVIDPCFWLKEEREDSSGPKLPYYLWDIEAERTVETSQLDASTIAYAIISYTWGRWRKPGEGVEMPGVPFWRVPENTRFDVNEFPSTLKRLGFREKYVWVDVLCIPQRPAAGSLPVNLAEICQQELARQAVIFQRATTAVAWFHDIPDWIDIQWNLEYMALSFLRYSINPAYDRKLFDTINDHLLRSASQSAHQPGLTFIQHDEELNVSKPVPVTWLTSLWTLQECMMRPDMILLNHTWEPLIMGGWLPGRIGDISALVDSHNETILYIEKQLFGGDHPNIQLGQTNHESITNSHPAGLRELVSLLAGWGLMTLMKAHPLTALVMGRSRYCEHSRAEAIMSVAGATEWHLKKPVEQFRTEPGQQDTADLVCGLYPLPFVKEVYKGAGANFFMWWHDVSTVCRVKGQLPDGTEVWAFRINRGSMMPFMPNVADGVAPTVFQSNPPGFRDDMDDHPAVAAWEIQPDGSVKIPAAGIVASKYPPGHTAIETPYALPKVKFVIGGNSPSEHEDPLAVSTLNGDLIRWMQPMRGEVYAVCTVWSRKMIGGILLQRLDNCDFLVKVGGFAIDPEKSMDLGIEFELPAETQVDWVVY